ncbi:MAG: GYD domain-containing protein [Novipirellula sp. JB048]
MATFITTIKFTPQGIKAIKDTTHRAAELTEAAKRMGVTVTNLYWTLGENDGTLIFDAPDPETAAALMMLLGSKGNVHTMTQRAFTAAEMENVLAKMPAA